MADKRWVRTQLAITQLLATPDHAMSMALSPNQVYHKASFSAALENDSRLINIYIPGDRMVTSDAFNCMENNSTDPCE